jgi:hypothetical protein
MGREQEEETVGVAVQLPCQAVSSFIAGLGCLGKNALQSFGNP